MTAINESHGQLVARCQDGTIHEADAAIVTVPLPILRDISLPDAVHDKVAASADIGYGNAVKIRCASQGNGGPIVAIAI